MLKDLDRSVAQPGGDVRFGPFSVFLVVQANVTEVQNVTAEQSSSTEMNLFEDSCSSQNSPKLRPDEERIEFCEHEENLLIARHDSIIGDVPEADDYTSAPDNVVALLATSGLTVSLFSGASSFWVDRLLSHYVLRVADVLQPISHPQSPFLSIHAQYAMGVSTKPLFDTSYPAEIGSSSHMVIFHSILSTAAFHLRGPTTTRHHEWELYDQIGRRHRLKALKYLQKALVEPALDAETHCARVSAILTLVTSDLVEGTSSEFLTHLQGCHQVRQLYSPRALGSDLHRARIRQLDTISFFLSTIAQTTAHHRPEVWKFAGYSGPAALFDTPFNAIDTCLEHTYGVTSSIATFIYLINKLWSHANPIILADDAFAAELARALTTLASRLNSWTPYTELFASIAANDSATLSLARDLATSFYCSAQMYFHSCFKLRMIDPEQHATSDLSNQTLLALERAERGKLNVSRAGASICWPAFVAACEAPTGLRHRWTKYWQTLLSYRIGSLQAVWKIVQEVWKKVDESVAQTDGIELNAITVIGYGTYEICEPIWTDVLRKSGISILAI